jgi:hypothetical protein
MPLVDFEKWVTLAPIAERSADEYTKDVKAMWASVESYDAPAKKSGFSRFKGLFSKPTAPVEVDSGWTDNHAALSMMLKNYLHNTKGHFLTYFLTGIPVGVMTLVSPTGASFKVQHIATHSAVSGAGGSMLEYAFYYAEKNNWPQKIQLSPLNHVARAAYKALGFKTIEDGTGYMALNPADSDGKWAQVSGNWRLAKYAGQDYVVT